MIFDEPEGPQERLSERSKTCWGCKHFHTHGVVFGHNFRKDNTYCQHPLAELDKFDMIFHGDHGKQIEWSTEKHDYNVPIWCPFKKKLTLDQKLEIIFKNADIRMKVMVKQRIDDFERNKRGHDALQHYFETGNMVWPTK